MSGYPYALPVSDSVQIIGAGLITPLGQSAWETFRALLSGQTLSDRLDEMPEDIALIDLVRAVGAVKAVQHYSVDPAIELAERAAREALVEADVDPRGLPCFLGSSKGAIHGLSQTLRDGAQHGWPAAMNRMYDREGNTHGVRGAVSLQDVPIDALPIHPCGRLAWHLGRRLGCTIRSHAVAACASSLVALDQARRYLESQSVHDTALVVTSEAALLEVFVHSYERLGALAPRGDYVARPFGEDAQRVGFVLAEQGAAVVLRRGDSSAGHRAPILHTATAADAHDLIRVAPGLPALRRAAKGTIDGKTAQNTKDADMPIACIHAHAPGTPDHDPQEQRLIQDLLRAPHMPNGHADANPSATLQRVYAAKGAIGHGLGASGLSALVLARLCQRARRRPPMPWLGERAPVPLTEGTHLVLAAGFAGHVAAASIF